MVLFVQHELANAETFRIPCAGSLVLINDGIDLRPIRDHDVFCWANVFLFRNLDDTAGAVVAQEDELVEFRTDDRCGIFCGRLDVRAEEIVDLVMIDFDVPPCDVTSLDGFELGDFRMARVEAAVFFLNACQISDCVSIDMCEIVVDGIHFL